MKWIVLSLMTLMMAATASAQESCQNKMDKALLELRELEQEFSFGQISKMQLIVGQLALVHSLSQCTEKQDYCLSRQTLLNSKISLINSEIKGGTGSRNDLDSAKKALADTIAYCLDAGAR